MTAPARWVVPFLAITLLVPGCGGGGGGAVAPPAQNLPDPPAPAPAPAPEPAPAIDVAAAWRNYVSAPHSWTMRGQGSDARPHEMTVEMKPGATAPFPMTGSSGSTTVQSQRFTIAGASTSTVGTLFFTPQTMIGVATDDGACAAARSAMAALPGASTVGANGPMFVLEGYAGCTISGQKLGTTTYKWSVEADAGLTLFCITLEQKNGERTDIGKEVDCMEASPDGTLGARARFTITRPDGNDISGKNY